MPKISPPPWTFDPEYGAIYDRRQDFPIMYLAARLQDNHERMLYMGALAAAAPDLQAALRELVVAIDDRLIGYELEKLEPELTGARAALARSEGKS